MSVIRTLFRGKSMSELRALSGKELMHLKYNPWKYSQEEFQELAYIGYTKDLCEHILHRLKYRRLTQRGIHDYLRHIPIRGYNDCPEEVLCYTDKCVKAMFDYSKEMGHISKESSLDDFLKSHGYDLNNPACSITLSQATIDSTY